MADVISLAEHESARARRLKAIEAVAVRGMKMKEAAAFAGLGVDSLRNLLKDERVKKYIARMQQAHADALNVRREDVIKGMLDAIEHAKMVNDPGTEIRGWEAIAKMQGYNAPDRVLHDLPDDVKRAMETMQGMKESDIAKLANMGDLIELTPGKDFREVAADG